MDGGGWRYLISQTVIYSEGCKRQTLSNLFLSRKRFWHCDEREGNIISERKREGRQIDL